ncbi:MAG TPA: glutamate-5-semialdehyde dehydrogenase [Spirochaetota bacterium]|nr:glutamate-5-semialdehyde dehydrogenase [Spirochaetota bacterium]HOS33758.1 glutamate-5-semialdehyde dehydrogenase [Spirochaetota bacterium]HOS56761.1 glutamate-5-semialdehyde dehydrogenase [Spirochaetota bacterium]HPK62541.1 glutamate-5-semialdehyde dehydrogenase [Spirochaetota bacterium]HQF79009.1 glutamate-5-semialdehyde dehydrogenase [Spirochaetota bacterium]
MSDLEQILMKMKKQSALLASLSGDTKNLALRKIADNLRKNKTRIIEENLSDIKIAQSENLQDTLLKRLLLDDKKIEGLIEGVEDLIKLEDPTNKILAVTELDKGLVLTKKSVPIGVIGVIFESRPDALIQISTLCIKSGNCVILKGGREAARTNRILADIVVESIESVGEEFENSLYLLETREEVSAMLKYDKYINLVIPRGSNQFVSYIKKNSLIPVLGHADGICHLYVDSDADIDTAVEITFDSKTQYVAACNALETLLVNETIAGKFLPALKRELDKKDVVIKGDKKTKEILKDVEDATEEDWSTEYLDYILSIKIVKNVDEAIEHINKYGSGHTDSIVSKNSKNCDKFTALVDSAGAFVNCSTRFSDGFRYGFGAEVGISTNKIHARGPVGLDGLVIYKYILQGESHIVEDYSSGKKKFVHREIS